MERGPQRSWGRGGDRGGYGADTEVGGGYVETEVAVVVTEETEVGVAIGGDRSGVAMVGTGRWLWWGPWVGVMEETGGGNYGGDRSGGYGGDRGWGLWRRPQAAMAETGRAAMARPGGRLSGGDRGG